ncbi:MAG TPA: class I SAM-dependent methyltransferase [Ktedonobacteraceae bacterium]|nr:class I SAM-dependent methyltransferase [Ktedonobacteraceae bacterium]
MPGRAEQTSTLLGLIPAQRDEVFALVELAAGGGELAEAILEHFPNCRYLALDGSEMMLTQLQQRLARFSDRVEIRQFDIAVRDWRTQLPTGLRCVLSSLCVHHLSGGGKRQLFSDMAAMLEPGGALLLADIIEPANQRIADLFAHQYDQIVCEQSLATRGDLSGYERYQELKWNYFRYDYGTPDTFDQPSLLNDQLRWLSEAGFSVVDCYWMRAGHAVYGGYK